jgi:hypothetical protein
MGSRAAVGPRAEAGEAAISMPGAPRPVSTVRTPDEVDNNLFARWRRVGFGLKMIAERDRLAVPPPRA